MDERIEELSSQKLIRLQYDKNSLELLRRERETVAVESTEFDRKIKDWEKLKHANASFHSNKLAEFKAKLDEKRKEYERMVKISSSSRFEDEELEVMKPNQMSLQGIQDEKYEVNRPVKHAQVDLAAKAINRRLRLKRIRFEDALEALFWVSPDDTSLRPADISIFHLENNLRREPFWLQKKDQRVVARYLVEDNYADFVQFSLQNTQLKIIVATIFKTMVGPYDLPDLQRVREHFITIEQFLKKCKNTLVQVYTNKERKEVITSALFEEKLERMPHTMMIDISQESKDIFILHAVERSANPEDIELDKIFSFFGAENFDSLYPPGFDNYNSNKTTPIYMRSVSRTKTTGKALYPFKAASGARTPQQSSRDNSDLGSKDDISKPLQDKLPKDKPLDILSEDLSQAGEEIEEQDMPVPQLSINTVDTFNNPLTQEIIYKLEQIKVAKEVTVALEKIVFEGMFNDQLAEELPQDKSEVPEPRVQKPSTTMDNTHSSQHDVELNELHRSFPLDLTTFTANSSQKFAQNTYDPNEQIPEDPNDDQDSFDDPKVEQSEAEISHIALPHTVESTPPPLQDADSHQIATTFPNDGDSQPQQDTDLAAQIGEK